MSWLKWGLPLVVLAVSAWATSYILNNKPQARRGPVQGPQLMTVAGTRLQPQDYRIMLSSYGVVNPRTESQLISQVAGEIVSISNSFRSGAFFEAGEELVRIDARDYRADVDIARAELVQAQLRLKEERARADQALRDWKRLGRGGVAGDLVLRKPQVAAAEAEIASARAKLVSAQLNLERTRIKAPYAGRILTKQVDLGQVVSSGSALADIFAVDYVEVRLPLNNRQLEYIRLPEQYRGGELSSELQPEVSLTASIGRHRYQWSGRVVRVEGAIDQGSRQLFVVAQVEDPYSLGPRGNPPLKIGQFVEARIQGELLKNVYVFPRSALSQDNSVLLIRNGRLHQRTLEPLWTDDKQVVVGDGLQTGELLNLTPLGAGADGIAVRATIDGEPLVDSGGKGDDSKKADNRKSPPAEPDGAARDRRSQSHKPAMAG